MDLPKIELTEEQRAMFNTVKEQRSVETTSSFLWKAEAGYLMLLFMYILYIYISIMYIYIKYMVQDGASKIAKLPYVYGR